MTLRCKACGCSELQACMTEDGPCWWITDELCSGCGCDWPRRQDMDAIDRRIRATLDELIVGTTPHGAFVWVVAGEIWRP
jgi:hypothetical protein